MKNGIDPYDYKYKKKANYDNTRNKDYSQINDPKKTELLNLETSNKEIIITGNNRKTSNILQQHELAELISIRATHVEGGAFIYVDVQGENLRKSKLAFA